MNDVLRLPVAPVGDSEPSGPQAPDHLTPRTQALWSAVTSDWELEPHQLAILGEALTALDRSEQARQSIEENGGPVMTDRFGQLKPHPGVGIERDARIAAARLFRELNLDVEAPEDARPPRIGRQT